MNRAARTALGILAATSLLILTAVGVRALDGLVTARVSELRASILAEAEQLLGRRLSYGSLSPSVLQRIEVRDLAILSRGEPSRPLLVVATLQIRYSLISLIRGGDPLASLREIRIANSRLDLDLEGDRDLVDLVSRLVPSGAGGPTRLRARISGAGVDVRVRIGETQLAATGLFFTIDGLGGRLELAGRGALAGEVDRGPRFSADLRAQGWIAADLASSELTVQVARLATSWLRTGRQVLQVAWRDRRLEVRKVQDRQPIDLLVTADFDRGTVSAAVRAEAMRLDRLATFTGGIAGDGRWLRVPVTGSGRIDWRPADGSLSYEAEVFATFDDQLPVHEVSLTARLRGNEDRMYLDPLEARAPGGALQFVGNLRLPDCWPEGVLTVSEVTALVPANVTASVFVQRLADGFSVTGRQLAVGGVALDLFEATLVPSAQSVAFTTRASFAAASDDLLEAGGEVRLEASRSLSVTASLHAVPSDQLYQLALGGGALSGRASDVRDLLAGTRVTTELSAWSDFERYYVRSPEVEVVSTGDPSLRLAADVALDQRSLTVSRFAGSWRELAVAGGCSVEIGEDGATRFALDARLQDTPYVLTGSWSDRRGLSVTGSYGLEVAAMPVTGGWSVRARADQLPVFFGGRSWQPSFDLSGNVTRSGDWRMAGTVDLAGLPFSGSAKNTLNVRLAATPRRLYLERIRYADSCSTLEGSGGVDLDRDLDPFSADLLGRLGASFDLSLRAAGRTEAYLVRGTLRQGTLAARVDLVSSPLARLGVAIVSGDVSGSFLLSGPVRHPLAELDLDLVNGRLGKDVLAVGFRGNLEGNRLEVTDLAARYLDHRFTGFTGFIDLDKAGFSLRGGYLASYFGDEVELSADAVGSVVARDFIDLGRRLFELPLTGRLVASGVTVAGRQYPGWELRIRMLDRRLHLDGGPGEALHATLDRDLSFTLAAERPLPVQGRATGRIVGDQLEAALEVAHVDARIVNPILRSPIFTVTSGAGTGRVRLSGELNDPDFTGYLDLAGGGMTVKYSPEAIGPVNTRLTLEGKQATSAPLEVTAGSGRLSGRIGFTLDHWIPNSFDVDLVIPAGAPVRIASKFGRVIIDGRAEGRVRIRGDDRRVDVQGSAVATQCRVTVGNFEAGAFQPEALPTFVNLAITTGKRIEFFWPSETFPVVRTMAASGGRLAVTYRGDTGAYTVSGSADIHGGEIFYFDRSFVLKEGTVTFKEDQRTFDPRILVRGEIREYDPRDGEEVRIYLDADGPLSRFSPRFSSDPTLTEPEILALLGAPIIERAGEGGVLPSAVLLSTDLLSQFGLLRPFEQRVRELLGLDTFSIRTQVLQNLLVEKLFGTEGANPLDNTSLSLGKYLGDDLFLEMLVRLQAPRSPSGLLQAGGGLQSDLELNLEWDTPFFLLEWTFQPSTPESLFLTDNSLALQWRYTW